MLRSVSFSGIFHAQRSLQDCDGRGHHIENDNIICFGISKQSPHLAFSIVHGSQVTLMVMDAWASLSVWMPTGVSTQERSRNAARFPFFLTLSTCCITGKAECHLSLFGLCIRHRCREKNPESFCKDCFIENHG